MEVALKGLVKQEQSELAHGSSPSLSGGQVGPKSLLSRAHADSSLEGGTAPLEGSALC